MGQLLPPKSHEQPIPDSGSGWLPESRLSMRGTRLGHRSGSRAASLRHISLVEIRSGLFGTPSHQGVYGRTSRYGLNLISSLTLIAALNRPWSCVILDTPASH